MIATRSFSRRRLRLDALTIVTALSLTFAAAPTAFAQSAQDKAAAESLFNDGMKALGAGQFDTACPKFAESQRLDPAIGTALYLGECYERSGKFASAWAMFREAQDLARKRNDPKRAAIARDRADRIVPSKLTVVVAPGGDIAGLVVQRDGTSITQVSFGSALPIDGGTHTITAAAPNRKPFTVSVTVPERGGNVTVTIPKWDDSSILAVAPQPGEAPLPGKSSASGLRIAGLSIAGVGVASVAVGAIFGVLAGSKYADSNTLCHIGSGDAADPCTTQAGVDLRDDAKTFATISTAMFIAGGVLVAGGLALFFAAPKAASKTAFRMSPTFSAGGAGFVLGGKF
ncbi:hypothetical protein BH09MYX1_BH09MYX1_53740 [soil metagenome]